jgi:hypothetical protein
MRTIRRLYFYLVAFISLEVVMWAIITLARTIFDAASLNNIGDQIAGGLAFLIVGLPMFLFHWIFIQRDSSHDAEERSSRLREIFLYGTYLAALIPIAQNIIALINRVALNIFELDNTFAFLGSEQTVADNLIAILVLGITFIYFNRVVKGEWAVNIPGNDLDGTRRLFRYIWMLYSLVLLIFSVNFILQFIFFSPTGFGNPTREMLANGLSIALLTAPLWTYNWLVIQRSFNNSEERGSLLRMVVLYLLALGGIITTLVSAGWVIAMVLKVLLQQEVITIADLFNRLSSTLAFAIPMGTIWAYFGKTWNVTIDQEQDPLRKAALRRLYFYILSLLGNIAVFFAIQQLLGVLIDIAFGQSTGLASYADSISTSLAMLIVGLPVWLRNWPGLQSEAAATDESGDHARRSVIRKGYLYLALFSLVVGMMASAGMLLYNLISTVTVENPGNPLMDFLHDSKTLSIIIVWLVYHFLALRGDGKAAQVALSNQHANFPVAILADGKTLNSEAIIENLKNSAPNIPVTTLSLENLAVLDLTAFKALVFSGNLLTQKPELIQSKLESFQGKRLVISESEENWLWQGLIKRNPLDSAKETARLIRLMAENQQINTAAAGNTVITIAYVLAGLFGIQILFMIIGLIASSF